MGEGYYKQLCDMQAEIDRIDAERKVQHLEAGLTLTDDRMGDLPIVVRFYRRPTQEQWRKLLDLMIEVQGNEPE